MPRHKQQTHISYCLIVQLLVRQTTTAVKRFCHSFYHKIKELTREKCYVFISNTVSHLCGYCVLLRRFRVLKTYDLLLLLNLYSVVSRKEISMFHLNTNLNVWIRVRISSDKMLSWYHNLGYSHQKCIFWFKTEEQRHFSWDEYKQ